MEYMLDTAKELLHGTLHETKCTQSYWDAVEIQEIEQQNYFYSIWIQVS